MLCLVFSLVKLQWLQELLLFPVLHSNQLRSWPDTVSRHLALMFHKVMGRNGIPRELLKEKKQGSKKREWNKIPFNSALNVWGFKFSTSSGNNIRKVQGNEDTRANLPHL